MIQINNLSHLYPNAEKNALSAVNFDIESASTITQEIYTALLERMVQVKRP